MLCFDPEWSPLGWTPAPHALAIAIGEETFALAVARRDANRAVIVHVATHPLDDAMIASRIWSGAGRYDVRSVYARPQHSHIDVGNFALRLRVAEIDPAASGVAPARRSAVEIDACELAVSVAYALRPPRREPSEAEREYHRREWTRIRLGLWG